MEEKEIYVSDMVDLGQASNPNKNCCDDSMSECDYDY